MQGINLKPGEFTIDSISLVNQDGASVDISKLVIGFNMYESIFNKFCTAELGVVDGLNILKYYKLSGQEFVRIAVRQKEGVGEEASSEFSIDKTFRIYKVENVQRPQELIQTYVIKMCDPRMFFCRRKRISRTLRGSHDQMLQKVLLESAHFTQEEFDFWDNTTPENYQFISPNWTVSTLIDYFTSQASLLKSEYKNGFFFYQSLNGGFRFQDISSMFQLEFPVKFSFKPRNAKLDTDITDANASDGLNTQILYYEKPKLFDTLQGTVKGMYSSFMKVYNPVKKLEEDNFFDIKDVYSKGKHISGYPMIRLDEDERVLTTENQVDNKVSPQVSEIDVDLAPNKNLFTNMVYETTMVHPYDDSSSLDEPEAFRGIENKDTGNQERVAMMEILDQHKILVTIPFRSDISCGMIINLLIPPAEVNSGDGTDKINDDRYLITSLNIEGNPLEYTGYCHLECVKESFAADIISSVPLENSQDPENV